MGKNECDMSSLADLVPSAMMSGYVDLLSGGSGMPVCVYGAGGGVLAAASPAGTGDIFSGWSPAEVADAEQSGVSEGGGIIYAPIKLGSTTCGYAAVARGGDGGDATAGEVLRLAVAHMESLASAGLDVESLSGEVVRNYEELALIYGTASRLGEKVGVDEICNVLVSEADRVLDANDILVQLADEKAGVFRTVRSVGLHSNESSDFTPALEEGLTGLAYVGHRSVIVCDVAEDKRFTGWPYEIRRFLTVPMMAGGKVIGLITATDRRDGGEFDSRSEKLISAMSSVAAIAIKNAQHYADIKGLLEGFIDASVTAVESRDPTTSGHSSRVAVLTLDLARKVDGSDIPVFRGVKFSREEMLELNYACLLHDFGKIGVSESVLLKEAKLTADQLERVMYRFWHIKERRKREAAERKLALLLDEGPEAYRAKSGDIDGELEAELSAIEGYAGLIKTMNNPRVLLTSVPELERLAGLQEVFYTGPDGEERPYLTPFEFGNLSVRKGSLNPQERKEIEMHVTNSYKFLSKVPWTEGFSRLSDIVKAHHEKLDGSGYPDGLKGDDIPLQSKMMAVADIYDALTACDRPYKDSVSPQKALSILEMEAGEGKLDPHLVQIFRDAGIYRLVNSPGQSGRLRAARG